MTQKQRHAAWRRHDDAVCAERFELDEGMCQAFGCNESGQVHHIVPRRSGGTSHYYELTELVTLCQMHHGFIHDMGWEVSLADGRLIGQRGVVMEAE